MNFSPTREQVQARALFESGEHLCIEALAGTGKTTTLEYLVRERQRPGRCLYTAFGKKVIEDAKRRFPTSCRVSTNHALAWGVGRQYSEAGRLRARLSPSDLVSRMGWRDGAFSPHGGLTAGAFAVIETLNRYCQTADAAILIEHALPSATRQARKRDQGSVAAYAALIADYAGEVWELMCRPGDPLPVSHDVYLKKWALGKPHLPYASILLDEAQDANGVIVGVLQHQEHAQLTIVGDRYQSIYGWRGAVDAMDQFAIQHRCALTQSWRFGDDIAAAANAVLEAQCGSNLMLQGNPSRPGHVARLADAKCVLARTNASLVAELFLTQRDHPALRLGVVGGVQDMIKLVEGAERLLAGGLAHHPELDEFESWADVEQAIEFEAYQHLRVLVELVGSYGTQPLLAALERVRGNEAAPERCDRMLSTAHKAKGSEYDSVVLVDDFAVMGPPDDPGLFGWAPEDGHLLYVAVTRARFALDPTHCMAALDVLGAGVDLTAPPIPPQARTA